MRKTYIFFIILSAFLACIFITKKQLYTNYRLIRYYYIPRIRLKFQDEFIDPINFRAYADFILDEDFDTVQPDKVSHGDVIYVEPGYLKRFFSEYYPRIISPFILITQNSDVSVPNKFWPYLNDKKIFAWFGQNVDCSSFQDQPCAQKMFYIPIGLISQNAKFHFFKTARTYLPKIQQQCYNQKNKTKLLYFNVDPSSSPERQKLYASIMKQKFCTLASRKPYFDYLEEMGNYKFIISPPGFGLDCYRTWESIYLGGIPIVKSSPLDPLYKDLPVLIVKDWNEITKTLLEEKWHEIKNKQLDVEKKLYVNYWLDQIRKQQKISRQS